ncbi:hypothetical protein H9P43_000333 [Blastocladiella emersonii ATCC 22665]|nr:hypothetical protein H9P43_000333 [Blastocladiella emersonii ATCC 22665]
MNATPRNASGLNSYFRQYGLMVEFKTLRNPNQCPRGMYLHPATDNVAQWHGVYFPTSGPYFKGVFRFVVDFPPEYPKVPPRVVFTSDMYHPLVYPPSTGSSTAAAAAADFMSSFLPFSSSPEAGVHRPVPGELVLLHPWDPTAHRALHVLWFLKWAFSSKFFTALAQPLGDEVGAADPTNGNAAPPPPPVIPRALSANAEAWDMYRANRAAYLQIVDRVVLASLGEDVLYARPGQGNPIAFAPLTEARFDDIKQRMLSRPSAPPTAATAAATLRKVASQYDVPLLPTNPRAPVPSGPLFP